MIYFEQKGDDWIVSLFVVKDLENHFKVIIEILLSVCIILWFVKKKCKSSDTKDPIHFDFVDENGFIELVFQQQPPPG